MFFCLQHTLWMAVQMLNLEASLFNEVEEKRGYHANMVKLSLFLRHPALAGPHGRAAQGHLSDLS